MFWIWLIILAPLPIALFPDGRLSSRWRWVVRGFLALCAILVLSSTWSDINGIGASRIRVDAEGALATTDGSSGGNLFAPLLFVFCLVFVIRQVVAYRRSRGSTAS